MTSLTDSLAIGLQWDAGLIMSYLKFNVLDIACNANIHMCICEDNTIFVTNKENKCDVHDALKCGGDVYV